MNSEFGELVNIEELNYAEVTEDSLSAYTTSANAYLAPAGEIKHEAKVNVNTRYYNGNPMFTTITEGETGVNITVSNVPMRLAATLTGKYFDEANGIMVDAGDTNETPYMAFSGKMELGDGGYRYFQYNKGKFSLGSMEASSKTDDIDPKTCELTYTAVKTEHKFDRGDGVLKSIKGLFADSTDSAFSIGDNWFDQVQTPYTLGSPATLTVTASPLNNATGVLATVYPTLTFNNAISDESVTLVKYSDNSIVTATKAFNATKKTLTITPSANLTASGVYLVIVSGVKDVFGQKLATSIIKFTVAS